MVQTSNTYSVPLFQREQEREIHHFHFTEWPDHGVPDSIKVVNFYRKVKSKTCCQHGPMVVHCRYLCEKIDRKIKAFVCHRVRKSKYL